MTMYYYVQVKASLASLEPKEQKYVEEEPRLSKQVNKPLSIGKFHDMQALHEKIMQYE